MRCILGIFWIVVLGCGKTEPCLCFTDELCQFLQRADAVNVHALSYPPQNGVTVLSADNAVLGPGYAVDKEHVAGLVELLTHGKLYEQPPEVRFRDAGSIPRWAFRVIVANDTTLVFAGGSRSLFDVRTRSAAQSKSWTEACRYSRAVSEQLTALLPEEVMAR